MAYENGKTYWIVPADNQQVALNVYGNGQVSQNRNVNLWQRHATADQLWLVEVDPGGGFARIKTRLDTAYALNIWLGADDYGNCDLHTWRDNTNDSKVNFLTVDAAQNRYRIQCYRNDADNDLFLTAESTASGANVRWTAWDDQALQVWDLVEYTGDAGGQRHRRLERQPAYRVTNCRYRPEPVRCALQPVFQRVPEQCLLHRQPDLGGQRSGAGCLPGSGHGRGLCY